MALGSVAIGSGTLRVGPVFTARLPEIQIVLEKPGGITDFNPAPRAEDLLLLEDGTATVTASSVARFEDTGQGLAIVLAIDASRSMQGQPLDDIKAALSGFIDKVGPNDRVALVSFADDLRLESGFGDSISSLRRAVDRLSARGHETKLNTGLYKALALFDAPDLPLRRRLIVISDGHDEGSFYKQEDVIKEAGDRKVPVDAIGRVQGGPRAEEYLEYMERLARLSGGTYVRANDSKELASIFQQGIERLHASPVATFRARYLHGDGQKHSVGVRFSVGDRNIGEDEIQVVLPAIAPASSADNVPASDHSVFRSSWLVIALGAAALLLLIVFLAAKSAARRKAAAMSPAAAAQTDARPPVVPAPSEAAGGAIAGDLPPLEPPALVTGQIVGDGTSGAGIPDSEAISPEVTPRVRRKTQIRFEFPEPAPGHPSAVLRVEQGDIEGNISPIEQPVFWIGAEQGNNLVITTDPRVSGFHACIQFQDGSLFLHDNNSTNGAFLNGERLADGPRPLRPGDRIKMGATVLVLMAPGDANPGSRS